MLLCNSIAKGLSLVKKFLFSSFTVGGEYHRTLTIFATDFSITATAIKAFGVFAHAF